MDAPTTRISTDRPWRRSIDDHFACRDGHLLPVPRRSSTSRVGTVTYSPYPATITYLRTAMTALARRISPERTKFHRRARGTGGRAVVVPETRTRRQAGARSDTSSLRVRITRFSGGRTTARESRTAFPRKARQGLRDVTLDPELARSARLLATSKRIYIPRQRPRKQRDRLLFQTRRRHAVRYAERNRSLLLNRYVRI